MKFRKILVALIFSGIFFCGYSQKQDLKTLIEAASQRSDDTVKVNLLMSICDSLFRTKPIETLEYGSTALKISKELRYKKGEAYALKYLGMGYFMQGEYVNAMNYFQQALDLFQKTGDKRGSANMLSNIGVIYFNEGNDARALELYLQSLKLSEEINDSLRVVTALINIGLIYCKKESTTDRAKENYLKALRICEAMDYQIGIGTVTVDLGELFFAKGDNKQALSYFEKSLEAYRKAGTGNIPYTLINIGKIYARDKYYQNAFKYLEEALDLAQKNNSKLEVGQALLGLANTYLSKGDYQKALRYFEEAEAITREIGSRNEQKEAYTGLSMVYAKRKDFYNAYSYKLKESELKDSLLSAASQLQLNQLKIQYEIETMLKENEVLKHDVKLKETKNRLQMLVIGCLFIGVILILIFTALIARANTQRKKANAELVEKNALITSQKQAITDSIIYARRIQNAILPPEELINSLLPQSFIFFRPRDIVSGDFYWLTKSHNRIICIAADCTGHGVPGAFMSMLGIAILNEIISRNPEIRAERILFEMRNYIVKFLHQSQAIGETKDGMDLALLIFDENMKKVSYAGANNPLIIVRDGEIIEYKPDKMPIGFYFDIAHPFTGHEIELNKGDMLYIFSDGYIDQFGGPDGKKFMIKNFKKLLLEISTHDLNMQRQLVENNLERWQGHLDQVDDILVVGIRI